jgi:hypothetical protein
MIKVGDFVTWNMNHPYVFHSEMYKRLKPPWKVIDVSSMYEVFQRKRPNRDNSSMSRTQIIITVRGISGREHGFASEYITLADQQNWKGK